MSRPRKLTIEEHDTIRRLREQGVRNNDIAKAIGRGEGTIDFVVAKLNLPRRGKLSDEIVSQVIEMRMKGVPNKVICRRLKVSTGQIDTIVRKRELPKRKRSIRWTAIRLHAEGFTAYQIAKKLKTRTANISRVLARLTAVSQEVTA